MPKSDYIALGAKVRAMYGRRMTAEDYRCLMEKKTVSEAATFLRAHRGYSQALSGLDLSTIHRDALEQALRRVYIRDYQRLSCFLQNQDKELFRYPVYRAEQQAILTAMHRLSSRHMLEPENLWNDLLAKKSSLDIGKLMLAENFGDIVEAAKDTIFFSALERSTAEGEAPASAFVDNMMQVTYFGHLFRTLSAHYAGQTKKIIRQALDEETDLMNLVQFLRLRKYFSPEDVQRYSFPLPCSSRLRRGYVQQLLASPDYDSAVKLVYSGPYGKLFHSISPTGLEAYLYTLQYQFNQRQIRAPEPTVYTPIAYLFLKEIELRNIISIIECIRYGISPDSCVTLIGV